MSVFYSFPLRLTSKDNGRFKNQHPAWKDLDTDEIGKELHADYVIYIEIEDLSLYQKSSFNTLLQGRARVVRRLPPRRRPVRTADHRTVRSYPDGYAIGELGPA